MAARIPAASDSRLHRPSASSTLRDRAAEPPSPETCDDGDRFEGIELFHIETHEDLDENSSNASLSSAEEYRMAPRRTASRTSQQSRDVARDGVWGRLSRKWSENVVLTVPQKNNRDHLALERTFLSYIRTSLALAMQGVIIAQLFRLQGKGMPPRGLYFYRVAAPLSVTCYGVAILVAAMGAHRFWRQQSAIAAGKVWAGGWELNCVGVLLLLVILTIFCLAIAISIKTRS